LIEACGLPRLPDQVRGASLIPLLKDPQAGWPHVAITSHTAGNHAVRDERFRYIRHADGSQELYDLRNDPAEWKNLAGDPAMSGVIGQLAKALPATEAGPSAKPGKNKPNIVLIMADDIGMECLSAYGGESHRTPHLDALAASGLRFENAHSQPICTPSRVQIMTGIHNNRNYLRFGVLDPQAATFGNLLRDAGYRTAIGGKWQLDGGFEAPGRFGFDRHCLWQLTRRPSRYPNPGLEIDGKETDFKNGEFGPDVVTDYLCKFMEENKDGPFFVYYPMMLPHWPFVPTPDHPDYDPEMWRQAKNEPGGFHGPEYWPAMVSYTDKMVGKMVRKLEELGIRDNTLILWTGDNGTYNKLSTRFRGRDYPGGKGGTKDNGTHVGFIASWPAVIKPGRTSGALVDFTDVLPTLAEAAGAEIPDGIDGVSLAPVFRGEARAKDFIYCWYARDGERNKASQHVRDARHKLYLTGKFFDVVADPEEKNNLAAEDMPAELGETRARLQAALDKHLAVTREADPGQAKRRAALKRGGNPGGPGE
jgi:arylsulfatase A